MAFVIPFPTSTHAHQGKRIHSPSRPSFRISPRALQDSTTSRSGAARSSSVQSGETSLLSPQAEALIAAQIARPIFDEKTVEPHLATLCAQAQQASRFLTNEEVSTLPESAGTQAAVLLGESVNTIISKSSEHVRKVHPGITEPGGGLYPPFRATACWRDFWQFVRVVSYGVAAGGVDVFSEEGMDIMERIYRELEVPLDAMITGVTSLKVQSSLVVQNAENGEDMIAVTEAAYGALINRLTRFT